MTDVGSCKRFIAACGFGNEYHGINIGKVCFVVAFLVLMLFLLGEHLHISCGGLLVEGPSEDLIVLFVSSLNAEVVLVLQVLFIGETQLVGEIILYKVLKYLLFFFDRSGRLKCGKKLVRVCMAFINCGIAVGRGVSLAHFLGLG